jgi:hypothetical protein
MSKILFFGGITGNQTTLFVIETGILYFASVSVAPHDHHVLRPDRVQYILRSAPDPVVAGTIHADVDASAAGGCDQYLRPDVCQGLT